MYQNMVKSGLISGLISGYENMAGFRPGPDMISGATLLSITYSERAGIGNRVKMFVI